MFVEEVSWPRTMPACGLLFCSFTLKNRTDLLRSTDEMGTLSTLVPLAIVALPDRTAEPLGGPESSFARSAVAWLEISDALSAPS